MRGYEGLYEVSDLGRVRSLKGRWPSMAGRILAPRRDKKGYLKLSLYGDSGRSTPLVHRLVAVAFLGPPPPGKNCVMHIDDNPANNAPSNLKWCDHHENITDMVRKGRMKGGAPHGNRNAAALSVAQVVEIKRRRAAGERLRSIAEDHGVSVAQIHNIATGKQWAWLTANSVQGENAA